jgi:hypothetical protein
LHRTKKDRARAGALIVALGAIAGGVPLAGASEAAAAGSLGLERRAGISGLRSMDSPKIAQARCPSGKVVVGGGAEVEGGGEDVATEPRLTRLRPLGANFDVTAEVPNNDSQSPWLVRAYAVCATRAALDEYEIVPGYSAEDSRTFKDARARCPGDTVAFGSGAEITYPDHPFPFPARVGLQLTRTSQPLDISRATGREYAGGYVSTWAVTSYAICAKRAANIHSEGTIGPGEKASHKCAGGSLVHGAGGGGGLSDGGPVFLRYIVPTETLSHVHARLTGPLNASIGGMVASATCGT